MLDQPSDNLNDFVRYNLLSGNQAKISDYFSKTRMPSSDRFVQLLRTVGLARTFQFVTFVTGQAFGWYGRGMLASDGVSVVGGSTCMSLVEGRIFQFPIDGALVLLL